MRSVSVDWGSGVVSVLGVGVLFDGFGEGERENDCLITDRNFFPFPLKRGSLLADMDWARTDQIRGRKDDEIVE